MKGLLLLILIWLAPSVSFADATESHQPKFKVEYRNVLIESWVFIQQLRDRLYAKTPTEIQAKSKQRSPSIPDAEQASPNAEVQKWRQRKREHHPAPGRTARGVSPALWQQNLRGGYYLAYTGSPFKRAMHQTAHRGLSNGDGL